MSFQANDLSLEAYKGEPVRKPTNEDVYRMAFQEARDRFSRNHLGLVPSKVTHQDILAKMYEVQKDPRYIPEYRQEIWNDFRNYQIARENYLCMLPDTDLDQVMENVRSIDPNLLGEERYQDNASKVEQLSREVICGFKRAFTPKESLIRKQGRVEVLTEIAEREKMDQKILQTFNRFIKAPDHPMTVRHIDEFFTYMECLDENSPNYEDYQVARQKFFAELETSGYKNEDLTFDRPLMGPQLAPEMYHMADFIQRHAHLSDSSSEEK